MVYLFGVFGVVLLALGGLARYEQVVAQSWRAKYEAADARRVAENERRLQVATAAEMRAKERARNDRTKAVALQSRSRELPSVASISLSADAVRLFRDASDYANGTPPDTSGAKEASPALPGAAYSEQALMDHEVAAAEAYRDAFAKWQAMVNLYEGLRGKDQSVLRSEP